jgi:hypothetical protein
MSRPPFGGEGGSRRGQPQAGGRTGVIGLRPREDDLYAACSRDSHEACYEACLKIVSNVPCSFAQSLSSAFLKAARAIAGRLFGVVENIAQCRRLSACLFPEARLMMAVPARSAERAKRSSRGVAAERDPSRLPSGSERRARGEREQRDGAKRERFKSGES